MEKTGIDAYMNGIARCVKDFRESKQLTQEQFADLCEVDVRIVQRIEHKTSYPTFKTLFKISNGLNMDLADMFQFIKEKISE